MILLTMLDDNLPGRAMVRIVPHIVAPETITESF